MAMEIALPLTNEWVRKLATAMEANTHCSVPRRISKILSATEVEKLFTAVARVLKREKTLVRVRGDGDDDFDEVVVVGDTHGQYHDVLKLFELAGEPEKKKMFVFNGDFVDRGAWGVEVLLLLLARKALAPERVILLRGNHETEFCTECYGFERELSVKYGKTAGRRLYPMFLELCAALPLACKVGDATLILHGGLFRSASLSKREAATNPKLGTLAELEKASKGGADPIGEGRSMIAGDVLWSDPIPEDGLHHNENRGIGIQFGPAQTLEFLRNENLKLIIRSHEGPDARHDRPEMPSIMSGFCVDHDFGEDGKLCTLFSAPNYPQFIEVDDLRHNNLASFVTLSRATNFCDPVPTSFDAVPRPPSQCYYELDLNGSDAEGPESDIRPHEPLHIDVGEGDEGARWKENELSHKLTLDHDQT
jgi:serine/threonine-protein phosphatase 5